MSRLWLATLRRKLGGSPKGLEVAAWEGWRGLIIIFWQHSHKKNPKALPPYSSEVIMCRPPPAVNPALHAAHAPLRLEGATAGRALPIISLPGERRECWDDALKERGCLRSRLRHFSFRKLFLFHFLLCTHAQNHVFHLFQMYFLKM